MYASVRGRIADAYMLQISGSNGVINADQLRSEHL